MPASQGQLITAKSGSNLAAAFFLLPKATRRAMVALYAFCRAVDAVAAADADAAEDAEADAGEDAEADAEEDEKE